MHVVKECKMMYDLLLDECCQVECGKQDDDPELL